MTNIGTNIANLRRYRNVTQAKLADYLYVTPQAISRWEKNITEPDLETTKKIADYFGVTLDDLVTGTGNIFALARARKGLYIVYIIMAVLSIALSFTCLIAINSSALHSLFIAFIVFNMVFVITVLAGELTFRRKRHKSN